MTIGLPAPRLRKIPRLRVSITFIFAVMVISSPVFMLANPAQVSAAINPNRVDSSSYHSTPLISETISSESSSATPTTSAPSTSKQHSSDFTTQAALSSLTARPTNNIVNTNSFYDVVFLTSTSGAIKRIQVTFPAGTMIPSSAFFNEAEKCVPNGNCVVLTGSVSKSGQTITYTVTNAVNVPAGTMIRLEFANVNNPLNPSANYRVTVTTRDAANTTIDGPTESMAYTIKQVGTNNIADGAITGNKISGINKLIFGSCLGIVPSLFPGGFSQFICNNPNASFGDMIVSTWSNPRSLPAPVLMNSAVGSGQVGFGFENQHHFVSSSQIVEVSYIIFKKP
jgi:hypothetical protein